MLVKTFNFAHGFSNPIKPIRCYVQIIKSDRIDAVLQIPGLLVDMKTTPILEANLLFGTGFGREMSVETNHKMVLPECQEIWLKSPVIGHRVSLAHICLFAQYLQENSRSQMFKNIIDA